MGALLKLVQPINTVPANESACRVLNNRMTDRLSTVNNAVRTLRAMGYRVLAQTLFPVRGGRPEVLIARNGQVSIGPLLDRSRGRQWITEAGKKRGLCEFQGVTVTWEEH
ncbi:MAG: hypothetical protein LWW92_11385 [Rhodocyclales bacterium]|nr:hypothetical protein [Rhodocyclales bacterium]